MALFALLGASVALAQSPPPTFSHIVIIVQENRTPDNLFGSYPGFGTTCGTENNPFETGVDIDNGGPSNFPGAPNPICSSKLIDGTGNNINLAWNEGGGDHMHFADWESQAHIVNGIPQMDGACYTDYQNSNMNSNPKCGITGNFPLYPPYTFMDPNLVSPYFFIAENYGFANYMFQTNEGPSFPAHQFLFGGTTAPTFPGDSNGYYQYFVSENPPSGATSSGCPSTPTAFPNWANPLGGGDIQDQRVVNHMPANECYDRNTLVTYQDSRGVHDRGVSWKYYVQAAGSIWDAPEADPQTCYTLTDPGNCSGLACGTVPPTCGGGSEFNNVVLSRKKGRSDAPILDDIQECMLASVSWVTPDEAWSDHPGIPLMQKDKGLGPDWVAAIINSIG
jgi:phospholipase C